jgi:signal transduction histidine kinase
MKRRVLVVDDDKHIREILSFNVKRMGLDTLEAVNGRDALETLLHNEVDVILADVWMPEMSGIDLLRWVKEHRPETPVALISGQATLDTTIDALNVGAFAYLLKPVQAEQIREVVRRGLAKVDEIEATRAMSRRLESLSELEQTLKSLHANMARPANGDVDGLIDGLRHELGNLSMAITLNLSSLELQGSLPEELRANLEDLHATADDLVALVNRLKEYPMLDKAAEYHDLRAVAVGTLETLQVQSEAKQVELQLRYTDEPVLVTCEPQALQRALRQIVENALEAAPIGGYVEVVITNSELERAALVVNDNGPGFDADALPKVFEPEYTTKLREGFVRGLGMGLFIARAIIELHGGTISARNRSEGGASVEIHLPSHSFAVS